MRGRVRGVTGHRSDLLSSTWQLTSSDPDLYDGPQILAADKVHWVPASAPSTVASCLRANGTWTVDSVAQRFDAQDWWYCAHFTIPSAGDCEQVWLCFDGLATVASVWLNGEHLFDSQSMFVANDHRITKAREGDNELLIRFRSLDKLLMAKRPRPRWRAPMIEHQQLRWYRTSLLGRTPGWSPPAAPVGPWQPVRIECRRDISVRDVQLRADANGLLSMTANVEGIDGNVVQRVNIEIARVNEKFSGTATATGQANTFGGAWSVPGVSLWWPHTHGAPCLYSAQLRVEHDRGESVVDLGFVGFRTIELDSANGDFLLRVNGVRVFARGACWTPTDVVALNSTPENLDVAFQQLVECGMNMVRVSGTMSYENDEFLDRCDAHGVLLWQDFMFANMDYPASDANFLSQVTQEVQQQLARLQGRPSVAILCGNSEGEQQAAMWGSTREYWQPALFHEHIALLARERCPDVPYWPSSASGGTFPHQVNAGTASYYGVGAYLRPVDDARRAEVRFASECLAFANIPDDKTLAAIPSEHAIKAHHPAWKSRSPRDLGAGWDFDDVRDHYVEQLFQLNAAQLRYADHARYLNLGRVATGEVMASVFAEWRREKSVTRGGLVWFLRDLWAGAGWGVIDAFGNPKAAWHYLRRALAPLTVSVSDEGVNGLVLHVVNDRAQEFAGQVELTLIRGGETVVGTGASVIEVAPHAAIELNANAVFDWFVDLSYSYRFGPPPCDVVQVVIRDKRGEIQSRAFHFVGGLFPRQESDTGLTAALSSVGGDQLALTIESRRFSQSVHVEIEQFESSDNYFHMGPGESRVITFRPSSSASLRRPASVPVCILSALNAQVAARISLTSLAHTHHDVAPR